MRRKSIKHLNEQELLEYVSNWERLAVELRLIKKLVSKVLCDNRYNQIMPKKKWDKLYKVIDIIYDLMEEYDVRIASTFDDQETVFIPSSFLPSEGDIGFEEELISEVRVWTMLRAYKKANDRLEVNNEER